MDGLSPWAAAALDLFADNELPAIYRKQLKNYQFSVHNSGDSLWVLAQWQKGGRVAFRVAYSPNDHLQLIKIDENDNEVTLRLNAILGIYTVQIALTAPSAPILHYTTKLTAARPLLIPFWPKDIIALSVKDSTASSKGKVYCNQTGTRSGLVYFSQTRPETGSVLYMQNLTALNDYCECTETSAGNLVGGQWPELGFSLPLTKQKPLPADKDIVVSDAYVALSENIPGDEFELSKQFLELLSNIYLQLPLPKTEYNHWPDLLEKGLNDLQYNHACWSHAAGNSYLNAYVSDYKTPPELMVQLAVLLPLQDFSRWSKRELPVINDIKAGLSAFYDEKIGTVVRWLPALAKELDGSEEQLSPNVMDSWYLHHPLLNLSRMALQGDSQARKLFIDSLEFTIKVAHHFKYEWPVFYDMTTLEVIKEETAPGMGGEHDVPGLYAHVMLQAWELTKDDRYLNEAKKAAKKLCGLGFSLFYQANNTAFSANAMLHLWKITGDDLYLNLSYLCLANIFKNFQLWDCKYGYAKHYPTFFGMFPLNDAPYTAAYEEQEVFAAMHSFLIHADGEDLIPAVPLLLAEFIRYVVHRAAYYYPPNLPEEVLSDEVKMGEVDPKLWIAIEDIHDGWEKSGQVGQEVYGAGVAFGIVPRHYYNVPDENFTIFLDYPTGGFVHRKDGSVSFDVKGDTRLNCRMLIIPAEGKPLPSIAVFNISDTVHQEIEASHTKDGYLEYRIEGNRKVKVTWDKAKAKRPKGKSIKKPAKKKVLGQ